MKVIVDTSVWSLALRRRENFDNPHVAFFRNLISDGRVTLIGAVRQELLSGIRHIRQFEKLKNYLRAFPDLEVAHDDYETAAEFFNTCRNRGLQGANTDFLICAAAFRRNYEVLTTDRDFTVFSKYIPIALTAC